MSEICRMERGGTAPPMPADGKCDNGKTPGIDDCRGELCDECAAYQADLNTLATMYANGDAHDRKIAKMLAADGLAWIKSEWPIAWARAEKLYTDAQPAPDGAERTRS